MCVCVRGFVLFFCLSYEKLRWLASVYGPESGWATELAEIEGNIRKDPDRYVPFMDISMYAFIECIHFLDNL